MDSSGDISILKYAAYFSEAISVGVLREDVDHVIALSELIKLGFLVKFNEEAVDFLMESKDLQIFLEDEELSRAHMKMYNLDQRKIIYINARTRNIPGVLHNEQRQDSCGLHLIVGIRRWGIQKELKKALTN
ncbi:hypothetical protein JHK87_020008 [Glycine soja]|nr:hypothetical protein JHK87_020008 [Glycine soja]